MAECIILKGGGGADLDVITTTQHDILAGKVGVDKEGNPITGTMPDCRKITKIRYWRYNNNRLEVAVDYGLHGSSWADNYYEYLEFGDIGIEPWKFRSDTNICGVQGGIPMQNPDVSGTDRVRAANMSNWAGTINLQVRNGHYLNGVNWVQQDIPNYQPWNIKKGVNIGGVVGTFEGYVASAADLYNRGAWNIINSGHLLQSYTTTSGHVRYDSSQIAFIPDGRDLTLRLLINYKFDVTRYSKINFTVSSPKSASSSDNFIVRCGTGYTNNPDANGYARGTYDVTGLLASVSDVRFSSPNKEVTTTMDLTNINTGVYFVIHSYIPAIYSADALYIKHIWFS